MAEVLLGGLGALIVIYYNKNGVGCLLNDVYQCIVDNRIMEENKMWLDLPMVRLYVRLRKAVW